VARVLKRKLRLADAALAVNCLWFLRERGLRISPA
jgi:hypothetical protein